MIIKCGRRFSKYSYEFWQPSTKKLRTVTVANGKIIYLDPQNAEDLQFAREAYGYDAEEKGWFRERDRLFVFAGALKERKAQ